MRAICDICGEEFDMELDANLFNNLFEGSPDYDDFDDECICFRCATLRIEEELCEETQGQFYLD